MKAYFQESFEDVTPWVADAESILNHFDDVYDLGVQIAGQKQDMRKLIEQGMADAVVTTTLLNIHTLVRLDLHSVLGQALVQYWELKDRPLPPSAIQQGRYLLYAGTDDWFPALVGDMDDTGFNRYAATIGVELVYGED